MTAIVDARYAPYEVETYMYMISGQQFISLVEL